MTRKEVKKEYKKNRKILKKGYRLDKKALKLEKRMLSLSKENYKEKKRNLKINYRNNLQSLMNKYVSTVNEVAKVTKTKDAPYRRTIEEIGNAVSHGVGSIFSIVVFILMLVHSKSPYQVLASIVYFIGLFMMFTMSCLYHSFSYASTVKRVFRRFDYTSIYLLIGATYAPILLLYLGGTYGIIFVTIQWVIIAVGITFVAVFGPGKMKWLHMILYIALGWSAVLFIPKMVMNNLTFFLWILGGGLLYMAGLIPFTIDKKVSHLLWHILVFLGALVQWIGIYTFLYIH